MKRCLSFSTAENTGGSPSGTCSRECLTAGSRTGLRLRGSRIDETVFAPCRLSRCSGRSRRTGAELQLLPSSARLDGPKAHQRFLVEARDDDAWVADRTGEAVFSSDNPRVAAVAADGTVTPVGNGSATIMRDGRRAIGPGDGLGREHREGRALELPEPRRAGPDAGSGATRAPATARRRGRTGCGCRCRAYAPEVDYDVLTRQALGRRVVKTAPAESLLLLKPTGAVEHGGGVRFDTDSLEYRVLSEWIAAGTPPPAASRPEGRRPEDLPRRRPAQARRDATIPGPGRLLERPGRGRDPLGQVRQHRRHRRQGGRIRPGAGRRARRGDRRRPLREPGPARDRDRPLRDADRPEGLPRRPPQQPDRRQEPRQARSPPHPPLPRRRRRRVPPPRLPRRDRHSASGRPGRAVPGRQGPGEAGQARRPAAGEPASTSITGRTSGPTCSSSRRTSCPRRRCGRSTGSCGRAWPRTCRGTGSRARS